jgi:hypothetical protein
MTDVGDVSREIFIIYFKILAAADNAESTFRSNRRNIDELGNDKRGELSKPRVHELAVQRNLSSSLRNKSSRSK